MNNLLLPASYAKGFARHRSQSAFPGLWQGLIGAWVPSLGPTGLAIYNWSRHQNAGVLTSMDAATDWVVDQRGYALDYDGSDYVLMGGDSVLEPPGAISISVWVKSTDASAAHLVSKGSTDAGFAVGYAVFMNAGTFALVIRGLTTTFVNSMVAPSGEWQYLACVYDGSDLLFYVDGELANSVAATGTISHAGALHLSRWERAGSPSYWTGIMQDVLIYDRALTHNEVSIMFLGASPFVLRRRNLASAVAPAGISMPIVMTQMDQFNGGIAL